MAQAATASSLQPSRTCHTWDRAKREPAPRPPRAAGGPQRSPRLSRRALLIGSLRGLLSANPWPARWPGLLGGAFGNLQRSTPAFAFAGPHLSAG